jgi:polysaccharide deacetylase family protein (PEP-CTERM system associated)
VFSVDVEDWYQGLEIDIDHWAAFQPRIRQGLNVLLELLDGVGARATFFVLGYQAERTPDLVRDLAARGHEIGSHGWSHRFVYRQRPDEFRHELRRSIDLLRQLSGQRVVGYRAPYFSITGEALWALDVLVEEGILYDSSIFPTLNYRYGIAGASRHPGWIRTASGARLFEVPLSTVRLPHARSRGGLNVPLGGGGYFRLYPYSLTQALTRHLHRQEAQGLIFYVHPWEYDPGHPRVPMPRLVPRITHYLNLASTASKTERLLRDFSFTTMSEAFGDQFAPHAPCASTS